MDRRRKDQDRPKETKLSSIEQRIYSTHNPVLFKDSRSTLHDSTNHVDNEWQELEEDTQPEIFAQSPDEVKLENSTFNRFSRWFFVVAITLFILVGGYFAYTYIASPTTILNNKIGFSVETPGYIDGGVEFPVDIYVTNGNRAIMERVDIVLEYPRGESITSQQDTVIKRVPLGNIAAGETKKGLSEMVLYGREGNLRTINAYVEYYAPGSSVVRKKDISKTISLRSAPVVLTLEHLKESSSNEIVAYTVRARAERGVDLQNFLVHIEYPNGFVYERASVEPRYGNNIWVFDEILKGNEQQFTVYGRLRGEDGDERVFRVSGGTENTWSKGEMGIVYADTKSSIAIKKPFIGIGGEFKDAPILSTGEFAIAPATRVQGVLTIRNNIQDTISNVVVTSQISGEVLNRQKVVVSGGYFNSAKNQITWDQSTTSGLKELLPGDEVSLNFGLETLSLAAKSNGIFSDPSIKIETEVRGRRLSDTSVPEVYSSASPLIARAVSDMSLKPQLLYKDGPFTNTGDHFPVAEKPTTYTLALEIQNRSNTVEGVSVAIPLPPYVEYISVVSPEDKKVTYNSDTREILWSVGTVLPGTGTGRFTEKVYIQIKVTPSLGFSLRGLPVTGTISLRGKDAFTESQIVRNSNPISIDDRVQ
jgi:hypothetical protein